MPEVKSCKGCKYLLRKDEGYSNYTVMETLLYCLKDQNSHLPALLPYEWGDGSLTEHERRGLVRDKWPCTNTSRCEHYKEGNGATDCFDVDGECLDGGLDLADYYEDPEDQQLLKEHLEAWYCYGAWKFLMVGTKILDRVDLDP